MTIPGSLRCILILLTFSFVVVDAQLLFLNILKKRRKKKERRNLINYCWIAQGALQSVASLRIFHSEQSEWQLQQSRLLLYSRLFKYVHTCVFSRAWNIEVGLKLTFGIFRVYIVPYSSKNPIFGKTVTWQKQITLLMSIPCSKKIQ